VTFPSFFNSLKALSSFPGWSKAEVDTGYLWFDSTLEIAGVTEEGLVFHGGCYQQHPDMHVVFELRAASPGNKRRIPLARVDWRSRNGGHTNSRRSGSPVSGLRVGETHFHAFDLNWLEAEGRMRNGNLPQAREIEEDIQTFESLRDSAGKLFRINNMHIVERPPWVYELF
jgi:hypothetical protein